MNTTKTTSAQKKPIILFSRLTRKHRRNEFDCGDDVLNQFLQQFALQNQKKHIANTFVAVTPADIEKILGFYSICAGSLQRTDFPENLAKKFPKYPIPTILIGRLAVDVTTQGQGVGQMLLFDALRRAFYGAKEISAVAVIVHAKHNKAKAFYEHFGFRELTANPLALFIPMKTIAKLM